MKNLTLKALLCLFALLCVLLFLDRSCTRKALYRAQGAHEQQKQLTKEAQDRADAAIAREEKLKEESDAKIQDLISQLSEDEAIEESTEEISELEQELPSLEDKDEIIDNLQRQKELFKKNFLAALSDVKILGKPVEEISSTGEKIIHYPPGSVTFELNRKYLSQVTITDEWIEKFNAERNLRIASDRVADEATKSLKRFSFLSDLKTAGLAGIGAGVLTGILTKDWRWGLGAGAAAFTIVIAF